MFDFGINRHDIREESCHGFHSVPTPCSGLNTRISHFASTWISQEWQTLMDLLTAVSDGHSSAIQYALADRFFLGTAGGTIPARTARHPGPCEAPDHRDVTGRLATFQRDDVRRVHQP
jgi:hypothetical protein